jgi:spermidine synthase
VGLGAGGLLAYARPEQSWDFYEIDPEVLSIARSHFTYLATSRAGSLDVILGDARLSLEETPEGSYDVLVMDVFSSDFIPTHLVTREAVVSQLARLRPDGILVFHISNRIFDLAPVLTRVARDLGVPARLSSAEDANDASGATQIKLPSLWLAMSRDPDRLRSLEARGWRSMEVSPEEAGRAPWTDQRVDLLSALRALRP